MKPATLRAGLRRALQGSEDVKLAQRGEETYLVRSDVGWMRLRRGGPEDGAVPLGVGPAVAFASRLRGVPNRHPDWNPICCGASGWGGAFAYMIDRSAPAGNRTQKAASHRFVAGLTALSD